MKPSREDIIELIQRQADAPAPAADPSFVDRLERRLRAIDLSPSKPSRRRIGRFTVSVIVAGTMIAGAAAAAGVVSWRNSSSQPPATSPTEVVTTTTQPPVVSSLVVVPITSAVAPSTLPTTTIASTTIVTASTEVAAATIVAVTTLPPPTTIEVISVTTSTEVRIPATLTLTCVPAAGGISCSWDAGPDGTTQYALLRTDSASTAGRVFTPEPGSTTYVDTLVVAGTTYRYLVHALDAGGHSLAHDGVSTACCG